MQQTEQGEKPIVYFSRKTSKEERRFHSFELELLAIVKTLERFQHYLLGIEFCIMNDCDAVKNAMSKQAIIPTIARWMIAIQEYKFKITHKSGKHIQHVDALSRNPEEIGQTHEAIVRIINEEDWLKEAQEQDKKIKEK